MLLGNMPIRNKLIVVIMATSGAVVVLTCAVFLAYEFITLHRNMITSSTTRAQIIAANSTAALAFQNPADAAGILEALKNDRRMKAACLYDEKGRLFAKYPKDSPDGLFPGVSGTSGYHGDYLDIFCPVAEGGRILGTVYLRSDLSALTDRYWAFGWLTVAVLAGSFMLALLLSRLLGKQIAGPILDLAGTARAISERKDFSVRARKLTRDELGFLTDAFNEMLETLAERTRLMDLVMRNMSEGIVVTDEKGKMTFFNAAVERITGMGKSIQSPSEWPQEYGVFREDKETPYPAEEMALFKAAQGVETNNLIQFLRNPNHPEGIFISVSGRPIKNEVGKLVGGLAVVRDIADERKLEEKKREYTRALEVSNKEMQDFVFVASHDLQEPLRKIQAFGEFLSNEFGEGLGETGRDYVGRMRSAAGRMQTLINDLLALTRITTKAKPFEKVDLTTVLGEVLSDLESNIQQKQAKVEKGDLPTLEADATQMRQLFQNLVGNALKYRREGIRPEVKVQTGIPPAKGWCRITVEDNGIGFDNKYAEQIFKVFERLHGREEYEGTGIGLAICRKVVERHGGLIKAEGMPGQGSVFTVELPLQQKK